MYLLRGTRLILYYVLTNHVPSRWCSAYGGGGSGGCGVATFAIRCPDGNCDGSHRRKKGPTCGKKRDNTKGGNNFCIRWWRGFPRVAPPYNSTPAARAPTFCFPSSSPWYYIYMYNIIRILYICTSILEFRWTMYIHIQYCVQFYIYIYIGNTLQTNNLGLKCG